MQYQIKVEEFDRRIASFLRKQKAISFKNIKDSKL